MASNSGPAIFLINVVPQEKMSVSLTAREESLVGGERPAAGPLLLQITGDVYALAITRPVFRRRASGRSPRNFEGGGWRMALTGLWTAASPHSSPNTPVPLLQSSGRCGVEHGPRHSCARADGRAGRLEETANKRGGGRLEEVLQRAEGDVKRVEIMAPASV